MGFNGYVIYKMNSESTQNILSPETLTELESLQMEGEPDIITELFETFIHSSAERLRTIIGHSQQQDIKALSKEAHALKSSARTIGALRLGDACQQLEHQPEQGLPASPEKLVEKIKSELDLVIAEIKKLRPEIK